MTHLYVFLAQAAPGTPSPWIQLVPMVLLVVIFYFVLVAPMRKRQRELQRMIDALKRGDRVVTNGGLHGEVAGLEGDVVHLKVADNVKVKVSKSAIAQLESK